MLKTGCKSQLYGMSLWIAVGLLSGAGCAKIGEPHPPQVLIPKRATDLAARQLADSIVLTVSKPVLNTDGSPATTLRSVEVYRLAEDAKTSEGEKPLPAEQFIKRAAPILSIPSSNLSSFTHDKALVIPDTLQFPQRAVIYAHAFRYAVVFVNNKHQADGPSNQVLVRPLPIPPPPENLSAEVTENAVRLKWTEPLENMDGSKPARIAGYNIYRSEERGKLPSSPMNSSPAPKPEFEDGSFQFDKTYYYAVSTVGSLQTPQAESLPSEAVSVIPRDVFPPVPPKDFNALFESGIVILLWTPSSSTDVAGYRIYRREKNATTRQLLENELITALSFRDTGVEPDRTYEYSIQAVDTHGNESAAVQTEVETR